MKILFDNRINARNMTGMMQYLNNQLLLSHEDIQLLRKRHLI